MGKKNTSSKKKGKGNNKNNGKGRTTNSSTEHMYDRVYKALAMSNGKTTSMTKAKKILAENTKLAVNAEISKSDISKMEIYIGSMIKSETDFTGIEGIPYQFMESVDPRPGDLGVGRKYAEKIFNRMPIVIMTPCKQVFMDGFKDNEKATVLSMVGGSEDVSRLIEGKGRYYTVAPDYSEYYDYLNPMLAAMASFLNLQDIKVRIGGNERKKLSDIHWGEDTNENYSGWLSAKRNLTFYADSMVTVSESFSNETMESSLASAINGYSDTAKEINFLLGGGDSSSIASNLLKDAKKTTSSLTEGISKIVKGLGGGMLGNLTEKGINTIVNGGKIQFPKLWADSGHANSISINFKFRSPDNDSLSIFLNVLKPYAKLLALVMPKADGDNINGYKSPHLVRCTCPGHFYIDMGLITGLSVNKGEEMAWNDDGLPTLIDVTVDIEDLYTSTIFMSGFNGGEFNPLSYFKDPVNFINNTAYMDFLMNTCGLNIHQPEVSRMLKAWGYLTKSKIKTVPSNIITTFDQSVTNWIGNIYNKLT